MLLGSETRRQARAHTHTHTYDMQYWHLVETVQHLSNFRL